MGLILDWPTLGRCGPGFSIQAHTTTLPVPSDDWLYVELDGHVSGSVIILASTPLSPFANTWIAHLGVMEVHTAAYPQTLYTQSAPAAGDVVDLTVSQNHANGTFVDQVILANVLTYDPISMLWRLTAEGAASELHGAQSNILSAVLVAKTHPGQLP